MHNISQLFQQYITLTLYYFRIDSNVVLHPLRNLKLVTFTRLQVTTGN